MTPSQKQALADLRAIAAESSGAFAVLSSGEVGTFLRVDISIDCRDFDHAEGGVRLRARERMIVLVPTGFPFVHPIARTPHRRWKDVPHVQWTNQLCLFQSVESEWDPSDGMFGYLERLLEWLHAASLGALDPIGGPLHPPVAYVSGGGPMFVPRVDTPVVGDSDWVGLATLERHGEHRYDITGWSEISDAKPERETGHPLAAVFLLSEVMPWEYPTTLLHLLLRLVERGIPPTLLFAAMGLASVLNTDGKDVYVVLGAPMRGTVGEDPTQHLSVWRMQAADLEVLRTAARKFYTDDGADRSDAEQEEIEGEWDRLLKWSATVDVQWCQVREARPDVTRQRDEGSPLNWWSDKSVAVWGCGALGSHIAEHLTRAGVRRIILRDNSKVAPGVLRRQNFVDADIGLSKAGALAMRLHEIETGQEVDVDDVDLTADFGADWAGGADVVLDLTASPAVAKRLELAHRLHVQPGTALVAMTVAHDARMGLVVSAPPGSGGGPEDIRRKAKIAASRDVSLRSFSEEFWPTDPERIEIFQPEPGCSSPTFIGSDAEIAALASTMLLAATNALSARDDRSTAVFVALPTAEADGRTATVSFAPDLILQDSVGGYEVRVAHNAVTEIRAWIRQSERLRPEFETGGILFGQRDDALGIIWVDDVLGPPPDSAVSPLGFVCGTAGVESAADHIKKRSKDACRPVGMWHTHPSSAPLPSTTDDYGMAQIVGDTMAPLPKQLLMIVGGQSDDATVGAFVYDRSRPRAAPDPSTIAALPPLSAPPHRIGLALSGGGFRAVAFHLGVLRALHDRGILDQVEVISSVSGGSIIAAMWAYGPDDFAEFDTQVTELLGAGLTKRIARAALLSRRAPQGLGTALVAGGAKLAASGLSLLRRGVNRAMKTDFDPVVEPPFRRWVSLTVAVQDALCTLFGDKAISRPTKDVHVIINACDLRTGTAFRFGSEESGGSRYGTLVNNDIPVAHAVAASAAYPVLLPALDVRWDFTRRDGSAHTERILLSDGGVYDNLGTSCLEPGRDPRFSTNVHPVDYIISADAGQGVLAGDAYPLGWAARMKRSFESVYRKVQDGGKGDLFLHGAGGSLTGFAMPFLGQNDNVLPIKPADLVTRDQVVDYPTDLSAMSKRDLLLLATRGEQLTRLLIAEHCPEIN